MRSSYFDGDDPPEPQNIVKVPKIEPKEEKWENELGANVKEELNDTDLEYLFQDVVRNPSLDEELKKDQEKKKDNARYIDMLVRRTENYSLNLHVSKKEKRFYPQLCFNVAFPFSEIQREATFLWDERGKCHLL